MNLTTLEKANALNNKIKEFNQALNCFQWEDGAGNFHSANPRLIIQYDGGDGREEQPLPMNLSNTFVTLLKAEISRCMDEAVAELEAL